MTETTVFIVDDDVMSAAALRALMMADGIAAKVFHSAESFLAAYNGDDVGCLLLDIRLGGMSGLELQEVLVSSEAPLSIIFVSGYATDADRHQANTYGAFAVLDKPFVGSELCRLVRAAISNREKRSD